jgi:putative hydrolase of the HAD superfamily
MVDLQPPSHIHFLEPIPSLHPTGGRLAKPVRAVLFDIYGTLFISGSGDIGTAPKRFPKASDHEDLGRRHDIEASPDQIAEQLFNSLRAAHERKQKAGIVYPEVRIDKVWQSILGWQDQNRIREFALDYEWMVNPSYPMPGLDETLRTLRRRGLVMGIISNAQFFTPLLFKWFLGASPEELGFAPDLTVYSYQWGEAKPSGMLFNHCANRLNAMGLSPESIVYVGNDVLNDIMPAAKVGWQTTLFAGDQRSLRLRRDREECRLVRPRLVISDLRQLLDWI